MSEQYQRLKQNLSDQLVRDKWKTMSDLMSVPPAIKENFKSAYDLFTWMEQQTNSQTGQKYLSPTDVSNLRWFFLQSYVGAANLVSYIDQ